MKASHLPFSRMCRRVLAFLKDNETLQGYPEVAFVVQSIDAHLAKIAKLAELLAQSSSFGGDGADGIDGYTQRLIEQGSFLGKSLEDLGRVKRDAKMVERLRILCQDLESKGTNGKIQSASSILNEAKAELAELDSYKIDMANLVSFEESIIKVSEANTMRAKAVAERRLKQLEMEEALNSCNEVLIQCDRFVEAIKKEHPSVYKSYAAHRKEKARTTQPRTKTNNPKTSGGTSNVTGTAR